MELFKNFKLVSVLILLPTLLALIEIGGISSLPSLFDVEEAVYALDNPPSSDTDEILAAAVRMPERINAYKIPLPSVLQQASTIITATSCSQEDVQAAIDQAVDGDTVEIIDGGCTWDEPVHITEKAIVLRQVGTTPIIDNTEIASDKPAIRVDCVAGKSFRITGMIMEYSSDLTYNYSQGFVDIHGDCKDWRIDHSSFSSHVSNAAVTTEGPTYGVVDHCYFENTRVLATEGAGYGADQSWQRPLMFGTDSAVYIESNNHKRTIYGNVVDSSRGGRYVFRYNDIDGGWQQAHNGCQGSGRGSFSVEVYHNDMRATETSPWVPLGAAGGTGVWFNNHVSENFSRPVISVQEYRSCDQRCIDRGFGLCDGTHVPDEYATDGNIPDHTGSHDGGNNETTLVSSSGLWTTGEWVGAFLRNVTDGSGGKTITNTSTTISAVLENGTENDWDTGDSFEIISGYPCWDQVGRSTDSGVGSAQSHQPLYEWNNDYDGEDIDIEIHPDACPIMKKHIQEDRDYFNDTYRPRYVPYPYPHPLTVQGETGRLLNLRKNMAFAQVNLGWDTITGATQYRISQDWQPGTTTSATSWSETPPNGEHVYMVYALDEAGEILAAEGILITAQELTLHGTPGDKTIHLNWTLNSLQSPASWTLHYDGPQGDQPPTIADIPAPTRAYTLTGLTNYTLYTITLTAVDTSLILSDTIQAMPVAMNHFIYLPLVLK